MVENNQNQENFDVKEIKGEEPSGFAPKQSKGRFKLKKKHIQIGIGVIIAIVLIFTVAAFLRGWFSFSKDKVNIEIDGPGEVASGEEIELVVEYQNNNRVALKDSKLIIDYPSGAYSIEGDELNQETIELGRISSKVKGEKKFKLRLAGDKGSIKLFNVRLNFQPENINSYFENSASFKMNINSVLIGLYLTVPQKAISGEEVSYILDYMNNSDEDFSNLKIELDYPPGFSFKSAIPEPSKQDNIWYLEKLNQQERGTVKVSGILEGLEGENKTLEAFVSRTENDKTLQYSQTNSITQISISPLLVSLSVNNQEEAINVSPQEKLNYKIEFENNSDIAFSQLVLKTHLEGSALDFRTVKLKEQGFFDSLNNVITWSAAGVPSLALLPPGESGSVEFSVNIKDSFVINDFNDRNFEVSIRAELETLNVPLQFNLERLRIEKMLTSKVNSKVVLQAKGYYNETTTDIRNSGPIPPKVNQTTTYTIHWQITNSSNDLENIRVTAILPQGISWQNNYRMSHSGTQLEYNERTKQIAWTVDKIPAATGFLIPVYELIFQVALTPSITQIGTTPVLIDESSLEGRDVFTEEILESFSPAIDASLPDDSSTSLGQGRVVE